MRITLTRLLEAAKYAATQVGQEIPDFFDYMSEFVEQVTRSLRNGLSFGDNFNCEVKTITLKHDTPQIVSATKTVTGIIPIRVVSKDFIDAFAWYYSEAGELTVRAKFTGPPLGSISVVIVLLF